jgi:hypothetical protein
MSSSPEQRSAAYEQAARAIAAVRELEPQVEALGEPRLLGYVDVAETVLVHVWRCVQLLVAQDQDRLGRAQEQEHGERLDS